MNSSASVFLVEHAINKIIEYNGIRLKVIPNNTCSGCYFNFCMGRCNHIICSSNERSDNTDIIFSEYDENDKNDTKKDNVKYRTSSKFFSRQQILDIIKKKYEETGNELYKDLLNEIS